MSASGVLLSTRVYGAALACLLFFAQAPASAEPVHAPGAEEASERNVGANVGGAAGIVFVDGNAGFGRQKISPAVREEDSEWARFRNSLKGLFSDQPEMTANRKSQPQGAATYPAPAPSIVPGAYSVPATGSLPGQSPPENEALLASARELVRHSFSGNDGKAPGALDVSNEKQFGNESSKVAMASPGQSAPLGVSAGGSGSDGGISGGDSPIPKSKQASMLEGMLLSELVDQVSPWIVGLISLAIFLQLIRSLIRFLQASEERAVRRKANDAKRGRR